MVRHLLAAVSGAGALAVSVAVPALAPVLTPIGGALLLAAFSPLLERKATP